MLVGSNASGNTAGSGATVLSSGSISGMIGNGEISASLVVAGASIFSSTTSSGSSVALASTELVALRTGGAT